MTNTLISKYFNNNQQSNTFSQLLAVPHFHNHLYLNLQVLLFTPFLLASHNHFLTLAEFPSKREINTLGSVIRGVTSHHRGHFLLIRNKLQVLPTLKGRDSHKGKNTKRWRSLAAVLEPACPPNFSFVSLFLLLPSWFGYL